MDQQKDQKVNIIQKTVSGSAQGVSPVAGHVVKLKTWRDAQNPEQSITGFYLLGNNQLNEHIEQAVLQMKPGDQWKVQLRDFITQKQQVLNILLISSQKSEASSPFLQNSKGSNARAEEFKKQGNALIKQKKYKEAIQSYQNSYQFVEYGCDQEAVQMRLSVISNLALATLNAGRYKQCLDWCNKYISQAVDLNKKIIYREVSAYKGLKQWQKAKQKATKAIQYFSNDAEAQADFKALIQTIEKQQKVQLAKQKKIYTNMFG